MKNVVKMIFHTTLDMQLPRNCMTEYFFSENLELITKKPPMLNCSKKLD